MAGFAQQPYAVMISFRFSESLNEANALQDALQARGHRTFVSNETPGADLQEAIATAMQQSQLQVLLAAQQQALALAAAQVRGGGGCSW